MRVTLLTLGAIISGFTVGIYANRVGDLTFYAASGVGAAATVTVFTAGMLALTYLRE